MQLPCAARACILFALSPFVSASTYVIDDDGGPGVDFTSIVEAVAAAGSGDILLVRPGTYAGFSLTYGASVLGDAGAIVNSEVRLSGLAAHPRASLAGLTLRTLRIESCLASVTIEDASVEPSESDLAALQGMVDIDHCADVRLRGVSVRYPDTTWEATPALHVLQSRVEVVDCVLEGTDGVSCGWQYPGYAQPGAEAVVGAAGASLHVARSTLLGGRGGNAQAVECQSDYAGDGKPGLRLLADALALVSGVPADDVAGGEQGLGNSCDTDGLPGNGIVVDASGALRISGVTVTGASFYPGCGGSAEDIVGPYTQAIPPDPTASFSGKQVPGNVLTFTIQGTPGDTARLVLGRQLTVVDLSSTVEDQLLVPLRSYDLGVLPPSGRASFSLHIPASWREGQLLAAQGRTVSPLGGEALTHSLPITIR